MKYLRRQDLIFRLCTYTLGFGYIDTLRKSNQKCWWGRIKLVAHSIRKRKTFQFPVFMLFCSLQVSYPIIEHEIIS